jgi:hypothetical protein|tara:strand:- start:1635 stop:1841 length:207 start_codon:yes stop_codon:yes gene_type:complete
MFKETVNYFKSVFDVPTAEMLALKELEDCKRKLLEAQTGKEYAESMCKYREAQIKRLTAYLHNSTEEK